MSQIRLCERCGGRVGAAGFTVAKAGDVAGESHELTLLGDFCSAACLSKAVTEVSPRPDFAGTKAELDKFLEEDQLDEAADAGAYDPPGAAYVRGLGGGGKKRFALPSKRVAS